MVALVYYDGLRTCPLTPGFLVSVATLYAIFLGYHFFRIKKTAEKMTVAILVLASLVIANRVWSGALLNIYISGFQQRILRVATPSQWRSIGSIASLCLSSNSPDESLRKMLPAFARDVYPENSRQMYCWIDGDVVDKKYTSSYACVSWRSTCDIGLLIGDDQAIHRNFFGKIYPTAVGKGFYIAVFGGW